MSLFIQSLVALAASVSAAPAAVSDAAAPAPVVSVETPEKVDFAPNFVSKLDGVTPPSEKLAKPIWGESWPQHTWWQTQPGAVKVQPEASAESAVEAFKRVRHGV